MNNNQLWLIKNKKNRVKGPLSTEDVISLIQESSLTGEEFIATYPNGKWKLLCVEPVFYDVLMDILSSKKQSQKSTSLPSSSDSLSDDEFATVVMDSQDIKKLKKSSTRKRSSHLSNRKSQKKEKKFIYKIPSSDSENANATSSKQNKPLPKFHRKNFFQKFWLSGGLLVIIVGFTFFYFLSSVPDGEFVELKLPRWNQPPLNPADSELLFKKAFAFYLKSSFSSYIKTQNLLVKAVEGNPKNKQAMALLCLVYLELWPFSKQNFRSNYVISSVNQRISSLDKGGVRSGICQSVELFVKGKYKRAKSIVDSSLSGLSTGSTEDKKSQLFLPIFYYLKASFLYYLNDYTMMSYYLDTIQKILPRWIRPLLLKGEILLKQNKFSESLSVYRYILKLYPTHKTARIQAGLIEYKKFKKNDKAKKLFLMAVNDPEKVHYSVISSAYLGLAEIFFKQNSPDQALMYARKSYSYNPLNKNSRELIIKLGGMEKLKQTKIKGSQLVFEGDQLILKNKIHEAISFYKKAFKVSKNTNSIVAIKIAKNFSTLGLFDKSMVWLKKAIEADPYVMESYILISKYYSDRYDFYNAEKILKIARRKQSGSYEISRAWANLALKRGAYLQAIQYAKRALELYETDAETLIILSFAYAKLGDVNKSLGFATQAKDIEPDLPEAQSAYAKALGLSYGTQTGSNYFNRLIVNYPQVLYYQMELAKYLFEDERYIEAQSVVQKVINQQPKYKDAYFYLGRIFMIETDYSQAYEAFLQAAILNPTNPKSKFYVGKMYLKQKNYKLAKKSFSQVLALNPLYPKVHYYLGRIAFLNGDYLTAIEESRLETQSNPHLTAPFLLAGESYEKLGRFQKCAKEYQKAIEKDPENLNLYVQTARCYRKSGLWDLAMAVLEKASGDADQGIQSGDPQLYKELAVIYEIRGIFPEAAESYCTYLNLFPTASDRKIIQKKVQYLEKKIGKKIKNCG